MVLVLLSPLLFIVIIIISSSSSRIRSVISISNICVISVHVSVIIGVSVITISNMIVLVSSSRNSGISLVS